MKNLFWMLKVDGIFHSTIIKTNDEIENPPSIYDFHTTVSIERSYEVILVEMKELQKAYSIRR